MAEVQQESEDILSEVPVTATEFEGLFKQPEQKTVMTAEEGKPLTSICRGTYRKCKTLCFICTCGDIIFQ